MTGTHIVLTTIGDGRILLDLTGPATVWVIADRKTPAACKANADLARSRGLDVRYLAPDDQDEAGKRCPEFYARLPWNSDARRNLGYLLAYEAGCERLILLDDDNYPGRADLVKEHGVVGCYYDGPGKPGDYYDYLMKHSDASLSARGLPYFARHGAPFSRTYLTGTIAVNLGLWTNDPDVDAVAWLTEKPHVYGWCDLPVYLGHRTWTPINSQNTCIARELVPAAFFVIQGYGNGTIMDRYGDIFAGYFLQAVMSDDMLVRIGSPIAIHKRNPHNALDDLAKEAPAIALLEKLLPKLREFTSAAGDVPSRYMDLADYLETISGCMPAWAQPWLRETAISMRAYTRACVEMEREGR